MMRVRREGKPWLRLDAAPLPKELTVLEKSVVDLFEKFAWRTGGRSNSYWNLCATGGPLIIWTWSKVFGSVAKRTGVEQRHNGSHHGRRKGMKALKAAQSTTHIIRSLCKPGFLEGRIHGEW